MLSVPPGLACRYNGDIMSGEGGANTKMSDNPQISGGLLRQDERGTPREPTELPRTIAELDRVSDDEVLQEYALTAATTGGTNYEFWLAEIERRRVRRQAQTMIRLTWAVVGLTVVVAILAFATLLLALN